MTNCPFCNHGEFIIVYSTVPGPVDASIVRCKACNQIYTRSSNLEGSAELYNDEVYKVVETRKTIFDRILTWEYKRVIRLIKKFKPGGRELLDFGSGKGHFADLAKKQGYRVKCVETSIERAEYAKTVYGLEVDTNKYTAGNLFGAGFDIITLFHVLEHLSNPLSLLRELADGNLEGGGLLVVEVPNFKSLQSRMARSGWMHLDSQRHVSHFTAGQLEKLAIALNFKVVHTSFFSFHLGVLGMTDTLLKKFGYAKNIIYELKNRKSAALVILITLVLPFAIVLESVAALFKQGGIVRKYFLVSNH